LRESTQVERNQGDGFSITIKKIPKPVRGMEKVGLKLK